MERNDREIKNSTDIPNDLKVPPSFTAHPCHGFEVTSGLRIANILKVSHDPGCHHFTGHTQILAVMPHVNVTHWKKEGIRCALLSILA